MHSVGSLLCLVSEASTSSAALQQALYLACALDAPLWVGSAEGVPRAALNTLLAALPAGGPHAPTVAAPLTGPSVGLETLQQYVTTHDVDLVVTDTPADRGPVPALAAASTRTLVEHLDCSLFVVEHATPCPTLDRILVPTDLSDASRTALAWAARLAAACDATIDLLHVLEATPYVALTRMDRLSMTPDSFPERRARRQLSAFLGEGPALDVPLESHLAYGDPADQIGRFLRRHAPGLTVLAAHGSGAGRAPDAPVGPVADRVLRGVTTPLFLVRPARPVPTAG
jgi:nucleotide-binding universal stress UspA family protein